MSQLSIFGTSSLPQAVPSRTALRGQGNGGFSTIIQGLSSSSQKDPQSALQAGPAEVQARIRPGNMANTQSYLIAQVQDIAGSNKAPSDQSAADGGTTEVSGSDPQIALTSSGNGQIVVSLPGKGEPAALVDNATSNAGPIFLTEQVTGADSGGPTNDQAVQAAEELSIATATLLQANSLVVTTFASEAKLSGSTDPLAKPRSATGLLPEVYTPGKMPAPEVAINSGRLVVSALPQIAKTGIIPQTNPDTARQFSDSASAAGEANEATSNGLSSKIANSFLPQSQRPVDPAAEPRLISKGLGADPQNPVEALSKGTETPRTLVERVSRSFETVRAMPLEAIGRVSTPAIVADPKIIVVDVLPARSGVIPPDFALQNSAVTQIGKSLEQLKPERTIASGTNKLAIDLQLPPTLGASAPLSDQIMVPPSDPDVSKPHPKAVADALLSQVKSADVQEGRTTINLQPRGLGSIEVEMMKEHDTTYKVIVRVENPMVLQMLREERHMLAQIIGISDSDVMSFGDASSGNQASTGNDAEANPIDQIGTEIADLPDKIHQDVVYDGVLDVLT